jgi:hypothetical protein
MSSLARESIDLLWHTGSLAYNDQVENRTGVEQLDSFSCRVSQVHICKGCNGTTDSSDCLVATPSYLFSAV